jgi:hypothetical protein
MQKQLGMVIDDNSHLIQSLHLELMLTVSKGALGCSVAARTDANTGGEMELAML